MKVLLIRLRLIGDVVFTTPAVAALRRHFPNAHLTYLVEPAAAPVVQHNPHLDRVVVAERPRGVRRLAYDVTLARQLRRERFDVVIDFHGGPRSAWLTRASGAPRRIGYRLPGRFWTYTDRSPWTRALVPARHSVDTQSELLKPLGVPVPAAGHPPVEMPTDSDAAARVNARLAAAGVPDGAPLAVIHASASSPFRRWPADRFARLAAALLRARDDVRIIFTTGPSEQSLQDELITHARELAHYDAARVVGCGDFDLAELRALLDRTAVYVGGDSGPLHIAATSPAPIVALFGPTVAARSLPWRDARVPSIAVDAGPLACRPCDQRRCVHGDFRCLTTLPVERVADAAVTILGRNR